MGTLTKALSGIGILIAIFLVLNNASSSVKVVDVIGKNAINGISVLQGRSVQLSGTYDKAK